MKILVVGDIHGDWGKLNALMQQKQPEIVLQCGDFGWWPQLAIKSVLYGKQKQWKLHGLKLPECCAGVYWCDGNHENHWDLEKKLEINGFFVYNPYSRVYYVPRGQTIQLPDGRNVLFVGGAESIDKRFRTLGVDWYPEELISMSSLQYALLHKKIDIVISHTCPYQFHPKEHVEKSADPSREALSRVLEKYNPSLWYFGHWHCASSGKYKDTYWQCLDYPGHGGQWWTWLK